MCALYLRRTRARTGTGAERLLRVGIRANPGTSYGGTLAHARIGLGYADAKWRLRLARLHILFQKDN